MKMTKQDKAEVKTPRFVLELLEAECDDSAYAHYEELSAEDRKRVDEALKTQYATCAECGESDFVTTKTHIIYHKAYKDICGEYIGANDSYDMDSATYCAHCKTDFKESINI